jgi:hypothetical protein
VCFSPAIDRQSVSVEIVRGLCDDWSNMNSAALVTDEQDALSLWSPERLANFVAVRIRCLSVWRRQSDMYPRNSAPSDV